MSSPAVKPSDPSNPSAYAPKWLRDRRDENPDGGPSPSFNPPKRPPKPESNLRFLPLQREDHLRELEKSLRVLQDEAGPPAFLQARQQTPDDPVHEGSAADPARAWTPPAVPALGQRRGASSSGGSMFIEGFRVPRSLEPQHLPPPPHKPRSPYVRRAVSLIIMSGIAAPLAYFSVVGWGSAPSPAQLKSAAVQPGTVMLASTPRSATKIQSGDAGKETTAARDRLEPIAAAAKPESVPAPVTPPPPNPVQPQTTTVGSAAPASGNENAATKKPLRQLDPDAIGLLTKQGEQFIAAGDLVTARIVFQRAAEAGNANAALALGATYDPMLLARLGVKGVSGDADKARAWYERAREFGSAEASRRLEILASR
jgi:hypothetical protein